MSITGARHVLVKAAVSPDGRCIVVAPGIEIAIGAAEVIADIPDHPEVLVPVLGFATARERERFEEEFEAWIGAAA
jgi:hypothetical protein